MDTKYIALIITLVLLGVVVAIVVIFRRHKRPSHKYKLTPTSDGGRCIVDDVHGTTTKSHCNKFTHDSKSGTCVPDVNGTEIAGHCNNKVVNKYYECNGFECVLSTTSTKFRDDPHCGGTCKQPLPIQEIQFTDLISSNDIKMSLGKQARLLAHTGVDNTIRLFTFDQEQKNVSFQTISYDATNDTISLTGTEKTLPVTFPVTNVMAYGDIIATQVASNTVQGNPKSIQTWNAADLKAEHEYFLYSSRDKLFNVPTVNTGHGVYYISSQYYIIRGNLQPTSYGPFNPTPLLSAACRMGTKNALVHCDAQRYCYTYTGHTEQLNEFSLDMTDEPTCMSVSLDGKKLAVASKSKLLYYEANQISLSGQKFDYILKGHVDLSNQSGIKDVQISQDGVMMAYLEMDTDLIVAGVFENGKFIKQSNSHIPWTGTITSIDHIRIFTTTEDKVYILILIGNGLQQVVATKMVIP